MRIGSASYGRNAVPGGRASWPERERFTLSPVARFTNPFAWPRNAAPLWRWCDEKVIRNPVDQFLLSVVPAKAGMRGDDTKRTDHSEEI